MNLILRHIYIWVILATFGLSATAQEVQSGEANLTAVESPDSGSICISILTCTPGPDLYSKFGHTALRVRDFSANRDVVFNYGCFDGSANDFVFKFLLGQTDYLLGAEPFDYLVERYGYMGVGVTEQVLNLSQEEAKEVLARLLVNLRPENQEYRYKWLGVNCTNMVQYMMESLAEDEGGEVVYDWGDEHAQNMTVRDMLHEQLRLCPWTAFGIDMILGHEIDGFTLTDIDPNLKQRTKLFLPSYFMEVVDRSMIKGKDGTKRKYVTGEHELIPVVYEEGAPSVLTPMVVFILLLMAVTGVSVYDWHRGAVSLWLDVTLAIIQGLAGLLVAFLYFFSEHPGVDSNWLVLIFNPLPLCYAGWMLSCQRRKKMNCLAVVNMAVLTAFLLTMWLCPQSFNAAMWMLALALWVRSIVYYIVDKKTYCKTI